MEPVALPEPVLKDKPAMATATDAALITAAAAGTEAAFRELFRRHTPHLLQFVARVLGPASGDAEDVVQDTWLRAYPALVTFRNESSFSTWLCSVGLRAALDSMRRGKRHVADSLFDDDSVSELPPAEDRMDLETAIASSHLVTGWCSCCTTLKALHTKRSVYSSASRRAHRRHSCSKRVALCARF
jgi:RNA polymerase sigma factor (sigma-70 family)